MIRLLEPLLRRRRLRALPFSPSAVIFDFDGVFTDNRVLVDQEGREAVFCHRGDGLGLGMLRRRGLALLVISQEVNPVVSARCAKLNLPCLQGIEDKAAALRAWAREKGLDLNRAIYLGNDVNDLSCMSLVGCSAVVADAEPAVLRRADLVLSRRGGRGAVRELCDLILNR